MGQSINKDTVISFQFATEDGWSQYVSISCGIVKDGTFPGEICLEQSIYHQFGFYSDSKGRVRLNDFPKAPSLKICQPTYTLHESLFHITDTNAANLFTTKTDPVHSLPSKFPSTIIPVHRETPKWAHSIVYSFSHKFPSLFNPGLRNTSKCSKVEHHIDTDDSAPVRVSPRPYSPAHEKAILEFLDGKIGSLIRKSTSPWASRALLTIKKTPEPTQTPIYRFCVDYRPLNKITRKNAPPLPNAFYKIQRATGHKWYTFLDFKDGFWHIKIAENDIPNTAFKPSWGLYEWLVMPFGLCSSPATFQAFVEEVLAPFRDWLAGLLDDVFIWGDSKLKLHKRLLKLMRRLVEYGIVLNLSKFRYFVNKGVFLGFLISENGIQADPEKVCAIRERPIPTTTTSVQAFIAAAGYMRFLIKDFSKLCEPLHEVMTGPKNAKTKLTPRVI
ncbi:hypothetical protein K3495_g10664 [Podosphaera aphanis]|nr:hypothetical protein K3495_g10664 [Podosphaera aphanis]